VTINYFREYNDQFNHFLFVALYDDRKAVFETIVTDFNPIINLITIVAISMICFYIIRYFNKRNRIAEYLQKIKYTPYRILFLSIIIFLFIGSIRGSFGNRPAMRKWSSVSRDPFLNKTIINPFRSLKYAISDFNKINKEYGENPFGIIGNNISDNNRHTITSIIEKHSKGNTIKKPSQIFLIVMESYDSWPLLDKYSEFGIATNLKKIENKGASFINFLPASASTMNSFGAIITGIPYSGVNISKIGAINESYPSSLFNQFKKLGYETNFFYGGFLSWQNIGNLVKNQGADNLYSASDAGGKTASGVWGIEDDKLFKLVLNTIDKDTNSFNVILTTSYHPPYSIDIYGMGFQYRTEQDLPSKAQTQYTGAMPLKALGHIWYSDKSIGDFVSQAEDKYDKSLYCFTGDHFGRRFINSKPNLFEKSTVPFIIYGSDVKAQINTTPGSHVDIIPTLVEMIAPKNYKYYSFGNSLFFNSDNKLGIGYHKIISKNELQYFSKNSDIQTYNFKTGTNSYITKSDYYSEYRKFLSLSWHFTVIGDSINDM
jgi:phosphoglycerol transferase MdoB-like AlkP superfamily enzyme